MDIDISPISGVLLDLLRRWPRKHIVAALADHPQPQRLVLSGQLAGWLKDQCPDATLQQFDNQQSMRKPAHDGVVGLFDAEFPPLLRHIPDPPLLLFYRGNIKLLETKALAVVGARRSTAQGRANAQMLARDLVARGITVVSGLALGIDGAAHSGALAGVRTATVARHSAGTIAVLGGGFRQMYPRRHDKLAREIVAHGGLLLSEYEDDMPPLAHQFPERNRIISGLSMATVVVEATLKSGSLITARFAAEQGRDVFAMPGPVSNAMSQGCHRLIQQGAGLISNAEEVLLELGLEGLDPGCEQPLPGDSPHSAAMQLHGDARALLTLIHGYPMSVDELLIQTGYPAPHLTRLLVNLELSGFVQQGPLGYSRASD